MTKPKYPRKHTPAQGYEPGHFTALMRHPDTDVCVWPPGFESRLDWGRSTASHAANGTALREANRGHAAHGMKPDGATDYGSGTNRMERRP